MILLEAFGALAAEESGLRLTIVGDGPLRDAVGSACLADPRIRCAGWVKGQSPELYGLFRSHDVLVLPSMNEGLPLVLLEAMANRVIVCSAAVGGVKEIVEDGKSGFLYETQSAQGLMNALRRILGSDDVCLETVVESAYEVALQNSYAKQRGALAQMVKDVLAQGATSGRKTVRGCS
jgi:glycosyltransferase involved in cell wall biosynthesis